MSVLLNTSFFFTPQVADIVKSALSGKWVPAANAAGESPATCLKLPAEEGIMRLAVQTRFESAEAADTFRRNAEPIAAELFQKLGAEAFTCFSTVMEIIDL